jgi:AcrR family transcriptional regulator
MTRKDTGRGPLWGRTPASQQRRRDILLAGKKIFFENGYQLASVDRIAEVAGTTKRTVYDHFGSKEALFAEVIAFAGSEFQARYCLEQHTLRHHPVFYPNKRIRDLQMSRGGNVLSHWGFCFLANWVSDTSLCREHRERKRSRKPDRHPARRYQILSAQETYRAPSARPRSSDLNERKFEFPQARSVTDGKDSRHLLSCLSR